MTDKKQITIEDIKNILKGDYLTPLLHIRDEEDPLYKNIRGMVMKAHPKAEDYKTNICSIFKRMMEQLNSMEANDYNKIASIFAKYEVQGKNRGISGERTYGYDISRVDRKLIRRRRPN